MVSRRGRGGGKQRVGTVDRLFSGRHRDSWWERSTVGRSSRDRYRTWVRRFERLTRSQRQRHRSPVLVVEPTNHCNRRCSCCVHSKGPSVSMGRERGYMDLDVFERVIEGAPPDVRMVVLHMHGEPLLHPRIERMISIVNEARLRSILSTNGRLLTPDRFGALADAGVDGIFVSVVALDDETLLAHTDPSTRWVERCSATFERAGQWREANQRAPALRLSVTANGLGVESVERFLRFWTRPGLADGIGFGGLFPWPGESDLAKVSGVFTGSTISCRDFDDGPVVLWDGRVSCCSVDFDGRQIVGHVRDDVTTLGGNSEAMREMRRHHRRGRWSELALCRTCLKRSNVPPFVDIVSSEYRNLDTAARRDIAAEVARDFHSFACLALDRG